MPSASCALCCLCLSCYYERMRDISRVYTSTTECTSVQYCLLYIYTRTAAYSSASTWRKLARPAPCSAAAAAAASNQLRLHLGVCWYVLTRMLRADKPRSNQVRRTTGTCIFYGTNLQGARSPRCNSSRKHQTHRDKTGQEKGEEDDWFTLSSSVILDKRFSTLTLEKPCPFGPSLRPKDSAKARHMYSVQSVHIARFLHPSDACIHPTPAWRSVSRGGL